MTRENNKEVIYTCVNGIFLGDHIYSRSKSEAFTEPYIKLSQYEVLESKLALAVLALQRIIEFPITDKRYVPIFQRHAQEALEAIEAVEHE